MFVKKIELKDYRNYDLLSLDFGQGTNIFHGNNAQGKTNLLEAIYLCATSKAINWIKTRKSSNLARRGSY